MSKGVLREVVVSKSERCFEKIHFSLLLEDGLELEECCWGERYDVWWDVWCCCFVGVLAGEEHDE